MTPKPTARPSQTDELYTTVTDEQFDDLMELTGQQVVRSMLWQDSMAAELGESGEDDDLTFDLDLYLRDGVYFELYGVQLYPSLDSEPMSGYDTAKAQLALLIEAGLWLDDLAVDEDDGLVLILCRQRQPLLYVPAGAWFIDEWNELPDDSSFDDQDLPSDEDNGTPNP